MNAKACDDVFYKKKFLGEILDDNNSEKKQM